MASNLGPATTNLSPNDTDAAIAYLVSQGWSVQDATQFFQKKPTSTTNVDQVQGYLTSLGWNQADIARLLSGPDKSNATAEGLFRKYAASSPSDQATLIDVFRKAGAGGVKVDPALLANVEKRHVAPDQPADLNQLLQQFSQLPSVQQARFIGLVDNAHLPAKSGGSKANQANGQKPITNPDVAYSPLIKAGADAATMALKKLLGVGGDDKSTTTQKGGGKNSGSGTNGEDKPDDSTAPKDTDKAIIQDKDDTAPLPDGSDQTNGGDGGKPAKGDKTDSGDSTDTSASDNQDSTDSTGDTGDTQDGTADTSDSDGTGGTDGIGSGSPTGGDAGGGQDAPLESEPD